MLAPEPGAFIVDGTVGGGGHAKELAKRVGRSGTLLGVDRDADAVERAREALGTLPLRRLVLRQGNYAELPRILAEEKLPKADALLLDLGFSSDELSSGRGFSFLSGEPLDMRYDPKSGDPSAAEILNREREEVLADIFLRYGEERNARRVAKAIVAARRKEKILRTSQLTDLVASVVPRRGKVHPATKVFMALRIFVNRELTNLETVLTELLRIVKPGGKVAVITFHSLEDRIVKHRLRELAASGRAILLTGKPITPAREEILRNPRSRSAKLRVLIIK
jgi:16S rRNA (cytosine1402-N4)-methyltransferase